MADILISFHCLWNTFVNWKQNKWLKISVDAAIELIFSKWCLKLNMYISKVLDKQLNMNPPITNASRYTDWCIDRMVSSNLLLISFKKWITDIFKEFFCSWHDFGICELTHHLNWTIQNRVLLFQTVLDLKEDICLSWGCQLLVWHVLPFNTFAFWQQENRKIRKVYRKLI